MHCSTLLYSIDLQSNSSYISALALYTIVATIMAVTFAVTVNDYIQDIKVIKLFWDIVYLLQADSSKYIGKQAITWRAKLMVLSEMALFDPLCL